MLMEYVKRCTRFGKSLCIGTVKQAGKICRIWICIFIISGLVLAGLSIAAFESPSIKRSKQICDYVTIRDGVDQSVDCDRDPSRTAVDELRGLCRTIPYEDFDVAEPRFIDDTHRKLFLVHEPNRKYLQGPYNATLTGSIELIENGTVHSSYDCGWKTISSVFQNIDGSNSDTITDHKRRSVLVPILVPDAFSFQHFLDGAFPKIAQAYELIRRYNVTVLLFRPRDKAVEEILELAGIQKDWVEYYDKNSGYVSSRFILSTCVTPPLHPSLWRKMRSLIGLKNQDGDGSSNDAFYGNRSLVVLSQRVNNFNAGRRILNIDEVVKYLAMRYGAEFVLFQRSHSVLKSMEIFQRTRIFIGVHGGAMYNLMFARPTTHIVEFMPTDFDSGRPVPHGLAHAIIWQMANMIGQPYWRIPISPIDGLGDVRIDVSQLAKVLGAIESEQNYSRAKSDSTTRQT